jgi:hypothetical protein
MSCRCKTLLVYLGALALALVPVLLNPVALQKSNTVRAVHTLPELGNGAALDVTKTVGAIPYQSGEAALVLPSEKYRRTMEEGFGNCSQKAFGLAWRLDREGRAFQVVHLLPLRSFLNGRGHTVLRARVDWRGREQTALVDLRQGALPMSGDRLLDVADLTVGPVESFHFASLNPGGDDSDLYYDKFLDRAVIGVISGPEVSRYFAFIDAVYWPLGNARVDKFVYDGLALALGYYPTIQVVDPDYLFTDRVALRTAYQAILWLFRSTVVVFPAFFIIELLARRKRS